MEQKNNLLTISITESFEIGKLEGQKETLKEVMELADADPEFIKKYCQARLKTLNDVPKLLKGLKGLM